MSVFHADGVMTQLNRGKCRLRSEVPSPAAPVTCGGTCGGEAMVETFRQWTDGAWYDVTRARCLNIKPLTPQQREKLLLERNLPRGKPCKCNWLNEINRVERPDILPPTPQSTQTKVEVPTMATKAKPQPILQPCPRCGGNGPKGRAGGADTKICAACIHTAKCEAMKKRLDSEAEAKLKAEQPIIVEAPSSGAVAMPTGVPIGCLPKPSPQPKSDPFDVAVEHLLDLSLRDIMKRQRHVRVAIFAILRAAGVGDLEEGAAG